MRHVQGIDFVCPWIAVLRRSMLGLATLLELEYYPFFSSVHTCNVLDDILD